MNDQILTSLSIITAFHNKNKSVIDAFMPLTEYGIALINNEHSESKHFDTEYLREKINNSSGININILTLKSLLKKLDKEKKIALMDNNSCFRILQSFKNEQDAYIAAIQDNHRNTHKFILEYKKYSNDKRTEEELTEWIFDFICEYRGFIDVKNNSIGAKFESEKYKVLLGFLKYINEYESKLSKIFQSIYFGANLYSLMNNAKTTIEKKEFQSLVIYLDSNFILRLLDLQEKEFTKETVELFETLKNNKIKLKIFEETVNEIRSVLSFYLDKYKNEKEEYEALISASTGVDGVLGAYFRRNLTFSQIETIIDNIDITIDEFGIKVDTIERYKTEINEEKTAELYKNKYNAGEDEVSKRYRMRKCAHYIQIIDVIKRLRRRDGSPASCLGNSKYVFLTCDLKLNDYCRKNTIQYKFPCIISQEILANDLLLFDPAQFGEISFQLLIALYNTSNYLDVHIFDKLKETINEIAKEKPDEAALIIRATKNCEDYSKINAIFYDDNNDDKKQLIALVEKIDKEDLERQRVLQEKDAQIAEQMEKAAKSEQCIESLNSELKEEKEKNIQKDELRRAENENYYTEDMRCFVKKMKIISVVFCISFVIATVVLTFVSGFNSWFSMPVSKSWWIYVLGTIFLTGSILGGICTAEENAILKNIISNKEEKLCERYNIEETRKESLRKNYLKKK